MDALRIKTLEEDNQFLLGQVQLLELRNRQLELRIAQLSVSDQSLSRANILCICFWRGGTFCPPPARVRLCPGNE